jgi:hypothetical protein
VNFIPRYLEQHKAAAGIEVVEIKLSTSEVDISHAFMRLRPEAKGIS